MDKDQRSWDLMEKLFNELLEEQEKKLFAHGRGIVPSLTTEDILQPNDYPELESNPVFRYEEGLLAGIRLSFTAFMALKREQSL